MSIAKQLHNILFIARKELQYLLHERSMLLWIFIMPIIFFYIIGTTSSNIINFKISQYKIPLAILDYSSNKALTQSFFYQLEKDYFTLTIYDRETEEFSSQARRLVIQSNFEKKLKSDDSNLSFQYSNDSNSFFSPLERLRLQWSIYRFKAHYILKEKNNLSEAVAVSDIQSIPSYNIQLDKQLIAEQFKIPSGFEHTIPGIMVMFILMLMLSTAASLLVIERQQGLLRRLASTPISRLEIIYGKWLGKMGIGIIQIIFGLFLSSLLFQMKWGSSLIIIITLFLSWSAFCAALGLWLGNWSQSSSQSSTFGILITLLLAAFGGCWWPIEITPVWMQDLQKFLPSGWVMDAMHQLISFNKGFTDVFIYIILLLISTVLLLAIVTRQFRYTE